MIYFIVSTKDRRIITRLESGIEVPKCFKDFESLESIDLSFFVELSVEELRREDALRPGRHHDWEE